jgi:hypothetical protein
MMTFLVTSLTFLVTSLTFLVTSLTHDLCIYIIYTYKIIVGLVRKYNIQMRGGGGFITFHKTDKRSNLNDIKIKYDKTRISKRCSSINECICCENEWTKKI